MADQSDKSNRQGGAAKRPDVGDSSKKGGLNTGAGQEATHGSPPSEHDREHQSNYGGGGARSSNSST